jgi:hypothetical protein
MAVVVRDSGLAAVVSSHCANCGCHQQSEAEEAYSFSAAPSRSWLGKALILLGGDRSERHRPTLNYFKTLLELRFVG